MEWFYVRLLSHALTCMPFRVLAHPRVLAWMSETQEIIDKVKNESLEEDMDNVEAIQAYFAN